MSSIIDYFKANKLNYTVTSTTQESGSGLYNPFEKSDNCFASLVTPCYWQVTFNQLVTIDTYIISIPTTFIWSMTE